MVNEFYIYGVKVSFIDMWDVSEDEPKNYVNFVKSNAFIPEGYRLRRITINAYASGKIDLNYELQGPKFERIRRITGRDARKVA